MGEPRPSALLGGRVSYGIPSAQEQLGSSRSSGVWWTKGCQSTPEGRWPGRYPLLEPVFRVPGLFGFRGRPPFSPFFRAALAFASLRT